MKKRPNILLVMVDQMAAQAMPVYGNKVCKAPHLQKLAEESLVFDSAYTNCPLCAPARASLMTGELPSTIGVFDNAVEFASSTPTMAHHMRAHDYHTILCGKMHFVGPDQVHGFNERITTDVYPAGYYWMADWTKGATYISSGVSMSSVVDAGPCIRSLQMDYDDEVEFFGIQKLYDLARQDEDKPFFMTLSFTHPHTPFTAPQEHWDRYEGVEMDSPTVPEIPLDTLDVHSKGLYFAHGRNKHTITAEHSNKARRAYYAMISYVDDKVGRIMQALEDTGLDENTVVIFTSDHGEMLGERGMWYKHCHFEWSCRTPLMIKYPDLVNADRTDAVVSLADLLPTFVDFATEGKGSDELKKLYGSSMYALIQGKDSDWKDSAISDYQSIGSCVPTRMIRVGKYKYHYTYNAPAMLFDMEKDPHEQHNLVGLPEFADLQKSLYEKLTEGWDPDEINEQVIASQQRRWLIAKSLEDDPPVWDHIVLEKDKRRFVRNAKVDDSKGKARFPYVKATPFDKNERP